VPAKWTGNGSKKTKPDKSDWYRNSESELRGPLGRVKGIFRLPAGYDIKSVHHFDFWKGKMYLIHGKFKDIALFWTAKEVDGFRYDMARNGSL
jgi:hypothetical protein